MRFRADHDDDSDDESALSDVSSATEVVEVPSASAVSSEAFYPASQLNSGPGMTEAGRHLVWRCHDCCIVNSVRSDHCAGGCHTARPFPEPLPGQPNAASDLEQAFAALPAPHQPDLATSSLRMVTLKCTVTVVATPAQCSAVVETIRWYDQAQQVEVVKAAVKTMQAICLGSHNLETVYAVGGFDVLFAVMKAYPAKVLVTVCQIVQRVSSAIGVEKTWRRSIAHFPKSHMVIVTSGIAAVLYCLRVYLNNALLVEKICTNLKCILAADYPQNADSVIQEGGLSIVVSMFSAHMTDANVIIAACGALQYICTSNNGRLSVEDVGVAIAAMRVHANNAAVVAGACALLHSFSDRTKSHEVTIAAGGLHTIVAAMKAHPNSVEIAQHGSAALWNSWDVCTENHTDIAEAGGVTAMLAAMDHLKNYEVTRTCTVAVSHLLQFDKIAAAVASQGAIGVFLRAMINYKKDHDIISYAVIAISHLSEFGVYVDDPKLEDLLEEVITLNAAGAAGEEHSTEYIVRRINVAMGGLLPS